MGLDMSLLVYEPNYAVYARPIEVRPIVSLPGGDSYIARGIYGTQDVAVPAEDGSLISDQQTILDILEIEFPTLPRQRDQIFIGADDAVPAKGLFEVVDSSSNGGGETTLVIRQVETRAP
jgi:hypothetical protein